MQDALQRAAQDAEDRAARTRREAAGEAAEAARQVGEAKGQLAVLRGQLEAAREDAALAASAAPQRCLPAPAPRVALHALLVAWEGGARMPSACGSAAVCFDSRCLWP